MSSCIVDPNWLRPGPWINECRRTVFQLMEIDHYEKFERMVGSEAIIHPTIRMFGVTRNGHSILCHVHRFHPYFYVYTAKKPDLRKLHAFRKELNQRCKESDFNRLPLYEHVLRVDYVAAQSIYGYSGPFHGGHFLKITVSLPRIMKHVQDIIEILQEDLSWTGGYIPGEADERGSQFFESNIDYELRFMVDKHLLGCGWVELMAGRHDFIEQKHFTSTCQVECEVDLGWIPDLDIIEPHYEEVPHYAPLRTLSFDIECTLREENRPDPLYDQLIQIANVLVEHGDKKPIVNCIFTLRSCAPIDGARVRSFNSERELLMAWQEFVIKTDPDIITGYYIDQFDIPFLLGRAKFFKLDQFPFLGRIKGSPVVEKIKSGTNEKQLNIKGRILFDVHTMMRRDHKSLEKYTLDAVSKQFLKKQKDPIHFTQITGLFNGDDQTRCKLARYCLKDATLPLDLIDHLGCDIDYMEMAKVAGVPLNYLLTTSQDQQNKFISVILRQARKFKYLLPTIPSIDLTKLPPSDPLYPFIMIQNNLCYTTLLSPNMISRCHLNERDYIKTPAGHCFKKPDASQRTVLPQMLSNLFASIRRVRDDLIRETDPPKMIVLRKRMVALKLCANSMHQFTSAASGRLPCLEVSQSAISLALRMSHMTRMQLLDSGDA